MSDTVTKTYVLFRGNEEEIRIPCDFWWDSREGCWYYEGCRPPEGVVLTREEKSEISNWAVTTEPES